MSISRARVVLSLLDTLVGLKIFDVIHYATPNFLTVLNYHRIEDPFKQGFDTFKPNISATPQEFSRQMEYVKARFNVITCEQLAACLRGEKKLPPHAAIITFDDGYTDNLTNALPILQKYNLPAVIFLTTDFMGSDLPFYWDAVAYCFYHTKKNDAFLPLTGECSWHDEHSRERIMLRWIEAVKKLPEDEKRAMIRQIGPLLDVDIPAGAFANLHLTWEQVRAMRRSGIEFGSHTAAHPILTRIPLEQARREIQESKRKIEAEIAEPVISLAYPNGGSADFSPDVMEAARQAGIEVAFTLLSGPTRYATVRKNPLAVRRIFLTYHDTFSKFVMKLMGITRLLNK